MFRALTCPSSGGVVYSRLEERGYQMLCLYSCSYWGWACQGPKHVEDSNVTYMFILNCALKLVEEIILYYDARSKKHKKRTLFVHHFCRHHIPHSEMSSYTSSVYVCPGLDACKMCTPRSWDPVVTQTANLHKLLAHCIIDCFSCILTRAVCLMSLGSATCSLEKNRREKIRINTTVHKTHNTVSL